MDRAALVFWALATIALADIALINMPLALAKKGLKPRIGLLIGPLLGIIFSLLAVVAMRPIFYLILDGTQAVLSNVLDEEQNIISATWDNNGTRVVVWTEDETVSLYSLSQINSPDKFTHQEGELEHTAWGPDQQRLLTWGSSDTIELWTVIDTNDPQYLLEHDAQVIGAQWNTDSENPKVLSWTENNTIYVWDPIANLDLPLVLRSPNDELIDVAWSEDETKILLWYIDGTVRIWDIEDIAAGNRLSVTEDALERSPFLAARVQSRSVASRAGLRSGDMLVWVGNSTLDLADVLAENNVDTAQQEVNEINSAIRSSVTTLLDTAFSEALPDEEISVGVYRDGNVVSITLDIPPVSLENATQEFGDLGFAVNYVGQNPIIIQSDTNIAELYSLPWSPDRSMIMAWSVDNHIRVYDVNSPSNVISLPYQQDVLGAFWSDNNNEVIFWTTDEVFAWSLVDDYSRFRSSASDDVARRAGIVVEGDSDTSAGLQPGDVVLSIGGTPIDIDALISENNISASTTRELRRAIVPVANQLIAQTAVKATVAGQTTFEIEVYRAGETETLAIPIPQDIPQLFPALTLPFFTEDTLGITADFIPENPNSIAISSNVVDVAASSDEEIVALLLADETMIFWDLASLGEPVMLEGVTHALWNPDGTYLVTWREQAQEASIWSIDDLTAPMLIRLDLEIENVHWAPNNEFVAFVGTGSTITIWDVADLSAPRSTLEHDGNVLGAEWAPNENRLTLLAYLDNGTINTWAVDNGENRKINLNTVTTFADDLAFDVSVGDNGLLKFEVIGARTRTLEFVRALMAGITTFLGGYLLLAIMYRLIPSRTDNQNKSLGERDMQTTTAARQIRGNVLRIHYLLAIVIGLVALSSLLWNITKELFTVVAVSETTRITTLTDGRELSELDNDEIAQLIVDNSDPLFVRTAIRDYVWGVNQTVASSEGEGLDPIYETSFAGSIPEGSRVPEDITYSDLRNTENANAIVELMAYNTDKAVLDRLAIITGLSREDLAQTLFEAIGPIGTLELIVEYNIWPAIDDNPDEAYDPVILQTNLNLANRPPEGITFNTLPDYPDLLLEFLIATGPQNSLSRGQLEDELFNTDTTFDTSRLPTVTLFGVDKAPPTSILNRLVAQVIVDNTLANSSIGRLREIFRIYTWEVDESTAQDFAEEPILSVSELEATPYVPEDLDFIHLQYDPQAMKYILQESLNLVDLETIAVDLIVQPFVIRTWTFDLLIQRELLGDERIEDELAELNAARAEQALENNTVWNDAEIEYRSWINFNFLRRTLNADAELTGMRNAILGTLWVIAVTISFAFPVGIGAAIYLEEYSGESLIKRIIQTNIDNLAGVPSIIYGLLGVALFVRALEPITSGTAFGFSDSVTANGRTILSAGLTMGLLILPIIIINAQEAIRAVQPSIRQASFGLGATKWQTIWNHVLPYAMPGILTGTILAMSRAIGETAPLLVVGGITYIARDPSGPFSKFTALPLQIYFWTSQPRDADKAVAAAAIVVLLAILISLNSFAIILRNRFEKQVRGR